MKIGFTFDLRSAWLAMGYSEEETAEFDKESTIDGIASTLEELGYEIDRIGNLHQLLERLTKGDRWDLVFNICEGMHGVAREAQVPALLDAYRIPYVFSAPLVLALTLDKGMTKRVIRDAGIPTADFSIVAVLNDIWKVNLKYPLFVKPIAEGSGKGISERSVVTSTEELHKSCEYLLNTFHQPVLVEPFLGGREFTVGIVGTSDKARVTGVMEIVLLDNAEKGVYSLSNKEQYEDRVQYLKIDDITRKQCENVALEAYRVLGCEDGGRVDIRYDSTGEANFIEVNPLPGLNPVHSDLPILSRLHGISFSELMKMIMDSAIAKVRSV
ncbi:MAG: D-alanine--D-alanine ligase [Bacteroidetes bacterium]|nr:D-alanine--D-alanine ligase [Bacteroidota bacterium]MBU1717823.1 D-alanine--D-alanine ligase [Bacteroidota bacterium]